MTHTISTQLRQLHVALDDLSMFDPDAPVSGADTVDVLCHYIPLLRKLPELATLLEVLELQLQIAAPNPEMDALRAPFHRLHLKAQP